MTASTVYLAGFIFNSVLTLYMLYANRKFNYPARFYTYPTITGAMAITLLIFGILTQ